MNWHGRSLSAPTPMDGRPGETLLGLRHVTRDDTEVWQVRCPTCAVWGDVDNDQLHGRVSTLHAVEDGGCGWHVTVDWAAVFGQAALLVIPS